MSSPSTKSEPSPMMLQWQNCKKEVGDAILFFRLGDFYEAFEEDASICARELDLTLTKRQNTPMSGIPAHAAESYIDKLISKGFKVAIAEQVEDAKKAKGLVKREVIRIITPGTVLGTALLGEKSNNYFAACAQVGKQYGLAFLDLSTAEFRVIEVESLSKVQGELFRFKPKELLVSYKWLEKNQGIVQEIKRSFNCLIDPMEEWRFEHDFTYTFLTKTLKVHSLDGFGMKGKVAAINAAGALLAHVRDVLRHDIQSIRAISAYDGEEFLSLDQTTLKTLELVEASHPQSPTLLGVLDHTMTAMGGRLIKKWVLQPLKNLQAINERQESIAEAIDQEKPRLKLRELLFYIKDIERLITKIHSLSSSPKDIVALKCSLKPIHEIKQNLKTFKSPLLLHCLTELNPLDELITLIDRALVEEPPLRISDGGAIAKGYNLELDELRDLTLHSKSWMANYQNHLRESSGIKTLKVGYTGVSGFFIEVSKGQTEKVPDSFHRRQTLTTAERYITPELKSYEEKILTAEEKMSSLESSLFQEVKEKVLQFQEAIFVNCQKIALLDVILSLAELAKRENYVKPALHQDTFLEIVEGRHPVIEVASLQEKFIPNDTLLNDQQKMMVITGPNMAGKSTYIRQVALITLMAHIGSFVPAKAAKVPITDKIFTRIGASDDLSRGQSTFMVEMTETANILHQATERSLVILDEIGRGTSTYDGISLAWSIAEHLLVTPEKRCKTLFATHYFELTKLEEKIPGAKNFHVAVHETQDQIIFLRKIVTGSTDKSYGIHVAQLAGIPLEVIQRAREILVHLEENGNQKNLFEPQSKPLKRVVNKKPASNEKQLVFI